MEFQCRGTAEGMLEFGPYNRARFKDFLKQNPGVPLKITADLPESGKLRRYLEGGIIPLITFYQEGSARRAFTRASMSGSKKRYVPRPSALAPYMAKSAFFKS